VSLPDSHCVWLRLAPVDALPAGKSVSVDVDGQLVGLFHTESGYRALGGLCLHMAARLGDGQVVGPDVVCPLHGWRYNLTTGARTDRPGQGVATYPLEIRNGWLYLRLPRRETVP
jgi:nitrite reductase/ring-hydroxylating ferredoxin subunit